MDPTLCGRTLPTRTRSCPSLAVSRRHVALPSSSFTRAYHDLNLDLPLPFLCIFKTHTFHTRTPPPPPPTIEIIFAKVLQLDKVRFSGCLPTPDQWPRRGVRAATAGKKQQPAANRQRGARNAGQRQQQQQRQRRQQQQQQRHQQQERRQSQKQRKEQAIAGEPESTSKLRPQVRRAQLLLPQDLRYCLYKSPIR